MIESSMMIKIGCLSIVWKERYVFLIVLKSPLNGSLILVLGVAYKQDIDDYRESLALKVIEHLDQRGAEDWPFTIRILWSINMKG